jgi:cyclohexa-1,5-dienecarbonyl-CoA hydratase
VSVAGSRPCVRDEAKRDGAIRRIVLDRPKGNVLDLEMIAAIRAVVRDLAADPGGAKLIVFEGAGEHFSFGASVPEHLPGKAERLIPSFHELFRELEALSIPTAAVVRGQCLGGAFELALWCGMVFCDGTARFGVPEIKLGVFPPLAALALPWRVTGSRAVQLILSGETVDGAAAVSLGLADRCTDRAGETLEAWFDEQLAGKSAVALRAAWRAARRPLARALDEDLPAIEKLYLEDLMSRRDPVEGLTAFLERRPPVWKNE